MKRNRIRKRFQRSIREFLDEIIIYRPGNGDFGELLKEESSVLCTGQGYRFYKFERVSQKVDTPGRIAMERTERILFFADDVRECQSKGNAFPVIRPGDWLELDKKIYHICAVQNDTGVYLTFIVKGEEA